MTDHDKQRDLLLKQLDVLEEIVNLIERDSWRTVAELNGLRNRLKKT